MNNQTDNKSASLIRAIPSSLSETIDTLGNLLGETIEQIFGQTLFNKVESLRLLCKEIETESDLHSIRTALEKYPLEDLQKLIHCFAVFFLISNQAEQCEIIKIKRLRQGLETPEAPRAESIAEAIQTLSREQIDAATLKDILSELRIIPTITAHPTEARRRSVLQKQLAIAEVLFAFSKGNLGVNTRNELFDRLRASVLGLLVTDDVRAQRLSVEDEVENGIFFLAGSILEIVPEIIRDIQKASKEYFGINIASLPVVLYRSWIGGDRDGNPNVTAQLTRKALGVHRQAVIRHYQSALRKVRDELSISTRKLKLPEYIHSSILEDKQDLGITPKNLIDAHQVFEPLREKCELISLKLAAEATGTRNYLEAEFLEDLKIIERSLQEAGLSELAEHGLITKTICQAQVFGFSLAELDIRQHSKVHQTTISEILKALGKCPDYSALDESTKIETLHQILIAKSFEELPTLSPEATENIAVFALIAELSKSHRSGLGAYVISMTHSVSDMLEPLVLWKLSGNQGHFPLDLSPLFETIEDLKGSSELLNSIVVNPDYQQHLETRHRFQEIMLGYSDSNKDGGYASANVLLYESQLAIAQVCQKHKISFQIFHGRGGSVGRGGGRAGRAILASPPESHSGKVRLTEQGEVISFRYSMPELGHRHLEQIVSAVILSRGTTHSSLSENELSELIEIAESARLKYRSLIDAAGFWEWYVGMTPIAFISSLPIASRPVMRSGANLEFENLRAIPWVFSWTQTRYNIPSWYGLGTALQELFAKDKVALTRLQLLYKSKIFFQALIDNAQQEMARARLIVAKQYSLDNPSPFHGLITEEFEKTQAAILSITSQHSLLDNNPVIQRSIATRNPYTDALNLIQVELLRRVRQNKDEQQLTILKDTIHMSISALAAAMQTTG